MLNLEERGWVVSSLSVLVFAL